MIIVRITKVERSINTYNKTNTENKIREWKLIDYDLVFSLGASY